MAALYGPWMLCLALLAASPVVAAHAQDDLLPDWIQSIFVFYAAGQISDAELVAALEYLVSTGGNIHARRRFWRRAGRACRRED